MRNLQKNLWPAAAVAALLAGPAFAFAAMGMGHGGFHGGGIRASGFRPPPPAIGIVVPPPGFQVAPPMRFHGHFFKDHDRFHGQFRDRQNGGWGWGAWGGGYGVYATGAAEPLYVAQTPAPAVAEPPPCPELLTWSSKLGRATRQRLCD